MYRRIYINAYSQLNLGDDLFVKILCSRYPKAKFFIMCNKKFSKAFDAIPNLSVIPFIPYVDGILRRMHIKISINNVLQLSISAYCDAIVNIGGSIFIENDDWENSINQYKKSVVDRKKPYYIIGSNFGPYINVNYYNEFKNIFSSVADICFRDKYSYKLFSDLPKVRYASDVIFLYPSLKMKYLKKLIVISVIDLSNRNGLKKYNEVYLNKMLDITRYFSQRGYSVCLMGFCEEEGDKRAISQIISYLNEDEKKNIVPYCYSGDIDEAIKLIQESQYVFAARFHAMILGWVFKKTVYPIVYSDKSLHVMDDIGFDGLYTKIEKMNELQVDEVYEYLLKSKTLNIEEQIRSANLQFKALDEFLFKDKGDKNK